MRPEVKSSLSKGFAGNLPRMIVGIVLIAAVLVVASSYFTGKLIRRQIFWISANPEIPSVSSDSDRLIKISNGGRVVTALFSRGSDKLIVIFHGNMATMKSSESLGRQFHRSGFSVLLVEYPGFGVSSGYEVTEKNLYSDVAAMIAHVLVEQGMRAENVSFYAESLGTGVAVEMAKRKLGSRMILVSPFTSSVDIAMKYFPIRVLDEWWVEDKFDNLSKAREITVPVLLIRGERDDFFPLKMSQQLHAAFRNSELLILPDARHEDINRFMNEEVMDRMLRFFS